MIVIKNQISGRVAVCLRCGDPFKIQFKLSRRWHCISMCDGLPSLVPLPPLQPSNWLPCRVMNGGDTREHSGVWKPCGSHAEAKRKWHTLTLPFHMCAPPVFYISNRNNEGMRSNPRAIHAIHLYWCCLLSPSSMKKLISLLCVPLVLFSIQYLVRMHVCTRRGRKFPAISFYLIRSVSQAQRQVNQSQNNRTDETESNWCHTHHNKPSHPNMQSALWFNLRHVSHKKSSSTVFITSRKKV